MSFPNRSIAAKGDKVIAVEDMETKSGKEILKGTEGYVLSLDEEEARVLFDRGGEIFMAVWIPYSKLRYESKVEKDKIR